MGVESVALFLYTEDLKSIICFCTPWSNPESTF